MKIFVSDSWKRQKESKSKSSISGLQVNHTNRNRKIREIRAFIDLNFSNVWLPPGPANKKAQHCSCLHEYKFSLDSERNPNSFSEETETEAVKVGDSSDCSPQRRRQLDKKKQQISPNCSSAGKTEQEPHVESGQRTEKLNNHAGEDQTQRPRRSRPVWALPTSSTAPGAARFTYSLAAWLRLRLEFREAGLCARCTVLCVQTEKRGLESTYIFIPVLRAPFFRRRPPRTYEDNDREEKYQRADRSSASKSRGSAEELCKQRTGISICQPGELKAVDDPKPRFTGKEPRRDGLSLDGRDHTHPDAKQGTPTAAPASFCAVFPSFPLRLQPGTARVSPAAQTKRLLRGLLVQDLATRQTLFGKIGDNRNGRAVCLPAAPDKC